MEQEKIVIKTADGNEHTYVPVKKVDGRFFPCDLRTSIFTAGKTSKVFLAQGDTDKRIYLIKRYHGKYHGRKSFDEVSDITKKFIAHHDNYLMHELYDGVDPSNLQTNYKVFEYKEGNTLSSYTGTESVFKCLENAHSIFLDYLSFLRCLKILHSEENFQGYIHGDIKPSNVYVLRANSFSIAQLIDMDCVKTKQKFIEVKAACNYEAGLMATTNLYYSLADKKEFFEFSEEDRAKFAYVFDTTAATKMFSDMLFGEVKNEREGCSEFNEFLGLCEAYAFPGENIEGVKEDRWAYEEYLKDAEKNGVNLSLIKKLREFFDKGIKNPFKERFCSVDDMIHMVSDAEQIIYNELPITIRTAKLKAISNNDNLVINDLKDQYIRRHDLPKDSRDSVQIDDLLNDIDERILPGINKESGEEIQNDFAESDETNEVKTPLFKLLEESKENYIITAQAGAGKTTSLIREFLCKLIDNTDELYVYVSLKGYSFDKDISAYLNDKSGFPFVNLSADSGKGKLTVFLDSFDEIKPISELDQEAASKNFWNKLSSFASNIRVIICTRYILEDMPPCFAACRAELHPLTENQIKGYLKQERSEELRGHHNLIPLYSNPLFLSILQSNEGKCDLDLMKLFLYNLYEIRTEKPDKTNYRELEKYIALITTGSKDINSTLIGIAQCFNSFITIQESHNPLTPSKSIVEVSFKEPIIKEYFVAHALFLKLCEVKPKRGIKDIFWHTFKWKRKPYEKSSVNKEYSIVYALFLKLCAVKPKHGIKDFVLEFFKKKRNQNKKAFFKAMDFLNFDYSYMVLEWCGKKLVFDFPKVLPACLYWISKHTEFVDSRCAKNIYRIIALGYNDCHQKINLHGCITVLSKDIFSGCAELNELKIPDSIKCIEEGALDKCINLRRLYIDAPKTAWIGVCQNLEDVQIGQEVANIAFKTFEDCDNLSTITVDPFNSRYCDYNSNCIIELSSASVVCGCLSTNLGELQNIKNISARAFTGKKIKHVTIPSSVLIIGSCAFFNCKELESIDLDTNSQITISPNAFNGCINLTKVQGGKIIDIIGEGAFRGCRKLSSFSQLAQIDSILNEAFRECEELQNLTLSSKIDRIFGSSFQGCRSLSEIVVASDNDKYHSLDNCIIRSSNKELVLGSIGEHVFKENEVCSIGNYAFCGRDNVSLLIPNEIEYIGKAAFAGCSRIHLCISASIRQVEENAFAYCEGIIEFNGSSKQWESLFSKQDLETTKMRSNLTIQCQDQTIKYNGTPFFSPNFAVFRCDKDENWYTTSIAFGKNRDYYHEWSISNAMTRGVHQYYVDHPEKAPDD